MSAEDPGSGPSQPPPAPSQPPAAPTAGGPGVVIPPNPDHPVRLDLAFVPESSREKALLRIITVIPPLLYGVVMSFVFLLRWIQVWFSVLTSGKVPRDAFDFMVSFLRWGAWLNAYMLLATDLAPPYTLDDTSGSPVTYEIPYTEDVPNWRALIPWWGSFWAGVALYFIYLGAFVMSVVAWWTIVVNQARRPEGSFRFTVITLRWAARVGAYQSLMTNERPPLIWQ